MSVSRFNEVPNVAKTFLLVFRGKTLKPDSSVSLVLINRNVGVDVFHLKTSFGGQIFRW